jgi:hypothetical protein
MAKETKSAIDEAVDDCSEQIGDLIGGTANAMSAIFEDAKTKLKDLAEDKHLAPIFTELRDFLKREYKPHSSPFDLFTKKSQPAPPQTTRGISPRNAEDISGLLSVFVKENRKLESFGFALERLREEKGLNPPELYHRAQIDKRLYSKILGSSNQKPHKPKKETAIAFGLALGLSNDEFAAFLQTAGFALSDSSIFDLVIRFCLEHKIYDLYEVNTLLLEADQKALSKDAE